MIDDIEYEVNADNTACSVYKYTGDSSYVTIPENVKNLPVTQIGDSAFKECVSLEILHLSDVVTKIGARAFYGWKNISY